MAYVKKSYGEQILSADTEERSQAGAIARIAILAIIAALVTYIAVAAICNKANGKPLFQNVPLLSSVVLDGAGESQPELLTASDAAVLGDEAVADDLDSEFSHPRRATGEGISASSVILPEEYGDGTLNPEAALYIINRLRAQAGLAALETGNTELRAAAQLRLAEIMSVYSSVRPNGSNFSTAIIECGCTCSRCGECICRNTATAAQTVDKWLSDESGRAEIFNTEYNELVIACGVGSDGVGYWVMETVYRETDGD